MKYFVTSNLSNEFISKFMIMQALMYLKFSRSSFTALKHFRKDFKLKRSAEAITLNFVPDLSPLY